MSQSECMHSRLAIFMPFYGATAVHEEMRSVFEWTRLVAYLIGRMPAHERHCREYALGVAFHSATAVHEGMRSIFEWTRVVAYIFLMQESLACIVKNA